MLSPSAVSRQAVSQVVDHYDNPRNVGSFQKGDADVGTGLVGAPACGDVMKLQIKVQPLLVGLSGHPDCAGPPEALGLYCTSESGQPSHLDIERSLSLKCSTFCFGLTVEQWWQKQPGPRVCRSDLHTHTQVDEQGNIIDSCFKTFGCGSAIASSSVATEWVKGKSVDEVLTIKNSDIAKHLSLPPVKLHCSMLAEDAIKAAVKDIQAKRAKVHDIQPNPTSATVKDNGEEMAAAVAA